jgi:hypothetical protein
MWVLAVDALLVVGIVAFIVIGVYDHRAHNGPPPSRVTQRPPKRVPSWVYIDTRRARTAGPRPRRRPGGLL